MDVQQDLAEVNGARLYYEVAGSGHPLVLIHGYAMDTRMWDSQFEEFAQHYQVVRYDVRGFGRSAPPTEENYSHVEDLKALLDLLTLPRVHLVGLSMGGAISISFAVQHPHMMTALVAADCGLPGMQQSDVELSAFWSKVDAKVKEAGVEEAKKEVFLAYPTMRWALQNPTSAQPLRQIVSDYSGWHWLHKDPARSPQPPVIERLENITVPALSIVGERDMPHYHAASDLFSHRMPNAKKVVIKGAGHMCNMESPERFNETVLSFLSNL